MKKFVTFSNFLVLLGIMTIFFYFIPAVNIYRDSVYNTNVNLFTATFGGPFVIYGQTKALLPCGGLIVGFFLAIAGIILTFLKCKIKFATLLAFPFYIAAGVLVACTATLLPAVNLNAGVLAPQFTFNMIGGAVTVCVFWFIIGAFALIDFIATIAKPKQQPVNY